MFSHLNFTEMILIAFRSSALIFTFSRPGTDRLETRLLQRAPRWRSCVSPRSSVRCSSCCSEGRSTTSKNEPDIGRNEGTATLARHSSTSQLQAVRPRVPVHPWFCTALLNEMLCSCHPWSFGSAIGRFCKGSTRRSEN